MIDKIGIRRSSLGQGAKKLAKLIVSALVQTFVFQTKSLQRKRKWLHARLLK